MERKDVYKAIDSERDYQDNLRVIEVFSETKLPLSGELLTMQEYVKKAASCYVSSAGETPPECLEIFRKIAAICVRCMENYGVNNRLF